MNGVIIILKLLNSLKDLKRKCIVSQLKISSNQLTNEITLHVQFQDRA